MSAGNLTKVNKTRMWANAQCDGHPAEYRWHPLSNAVDQIAKIFAPGKIKIPLGGKSPGKCIYSAPAQETCQISCKVWLTSVEHRWCSNEAKTRNLLKFAGVPRLINRSQPLLHQR